MRESSTKKLAEQAKQCQRFFYFAASGVYYCPGTRWYGNTSQGEYMMQKQARAKGNRPANGKVCQ